MLENTENDGVQMVDELPLILKLNANTEPLEWIDYEDYAYYASTNKILDSMGKFRVMLRGGINAVTGKQSILELDSIIIVDCDVSPHSYRNHAPALTNPALFERDRNTCGYCGRTFKRKDLSRDHIHPISKGGKDTWKNVITACVGCNRMKDDMTLEQAAAKFDMELLFVPYTPNFHEHLILKNRRILVDQMEFLMKGVDKDSRLHHNWN
jgi:hypothetical protein